MPSPPLPIYPDSERSSPQGSGKGWGWTPADVFRQLLQLDEVGLRRAVEQILVHLRLDVEVARDVEQLIAHIARMRGSQLAIALDIPLLQQVGQSLVRVGDALALGHALEDAAVLFIVRIADLDLVAQPSQKGLVYQVARRQVGREH